MSWFYQYEFVSPESSCALVKEELKSYFNTGAIDDILFPTWIKKAISKYYNSMFPIEEAVLNITDFYSQLPPDYKSIREAWICKTNYSWVQSPNSYYANIITKMDTNAPQVTPCIGGQPDVIIDVFKEQKVTPLSFTFHGMLQPGNLSTRSQCPNYCGNSNSYNGGTFDIKDHKFFITEQHAEVYILYYANTLDDDGYPVIPDNEIIRNYIEAFLKYKCFEQLSNNIIDETAKQIEGKVEKYHKELATARVCMETELKKQTVWQKKRAIIRDLKRNLMFEVPDYNRHYHPKGRGDGNVWTNYY
jgi:hypothetical protein